MMFYVKVTMILSLMSGVFIVSTDRGVCDSLVKESSLILMQTVPTHIQVAELKKKLIKNVRLVVLLC